MSSLVYYNRIFISLTKIKKKKKRINTIKIIKHRCYWYYISVSIVATIVLNVLRIIKTNLCMVLVLECDCLSSRTRCPTMRLDNGRVRVQSSGRSARITCLTPFKLVRGNQIATCVQGKWDTESPICASKFDRFILQYSIKWPR